MTQNHWEWSFGDYAAVKTAVQVIRKGLELEDFPDIRVTQLYRAPVSNKRFTPLFYVSILKQAEIERVFQIAVIMDKEVRFEKHHAQKSPAQCHNSQGFFHSCLACNIPPKCL